MRSLRYLLAIVLLPSVMSLMLGSCSDDNPGRSNPTTIETTPELVFREVNFGPNPTAQYVIVSNTAGTAMRYSARIASGNTWIELFGKINGNAPDSFLVNFRLGGVQAGTYLDTIIIESPDAVNSPYLLPVRLVIRNGLEVSPDGFTFSMTRGGDNPPPQELSLLGTSTTPIDLTLSHSSTWLILEKDVASTPDTVTLTASGQTLDPGVYHDTITLNAPTIPTPIPVPCSLVVASWLTTVLQPPRDLRDVDFLDANRGFAVGALSDATGGGLIMHTLDGGLNWTVNKVPDQALGSVTFVDADNGWAVGTRQVLRTRNASSGSPTWTTQLVPDTVNGVAFVDTTLGILVGKDGYILRTTDGGVSWNEVNSGTMFSLVQVQFASPDSGWAVGNNGVILFSADSGKSWVKQDWSGIDDLNGLFFADNMNGWVVGALGVVLHTIDAGQNWMVVSPQVSEDLLSVWVSPGGRVWLVGAVGTILYSASGSVFVLQSTGVTSRLKSVFFLDENVGWVVGDDGIILRTSGGGL